MKHPDRVVGTRSKRASQTEAILYSEARDRVTHVSTSGSAERRVGRITHDIEAKVPKASRT